MNLTEWFREDSHRRRHLPMECECSYCGAQMAREDVFHFVDWLELYICQECALAADPWAEAPP